MKWKTVLVTAVLALLVVVVVLLAIKAFEPKGEKEIKNRISQYKLIVEEQRLLTEIVTLRYDAAVIQSKLQPVPTPAPAKE